MFLASNLSAQVIIKEKVEINPPKPLRVENPIVIFPDSSYGGQGERLISGKFEIQSDNPQTAILLPEGGRVTAQVIYSEAAANAKIDLLLRQPNTQTLLEYANNNIGYSWVSEGYPPNINLEFGIYWYWNNWGTIYQGNEAGALITQLDDDIYQIGFEAAGDDWDYNELVIEITIDVFELLVQIEPVSIGTGETATIAVKKQFYDGRVGDFPAEQLFEFGMLEGCMAGALVFGADTSAYFNNASQPILFVAADSIENDADTVLIGVGLIQQSQNMKKSSNSKKENYLDKNQKSDLNEDEIITPDGFTPMYCFPGDINSEMKGYGNLLVGNECGAGAPTCNGISQAPLGFKEEVIEVTGDYIFNKEGYYPETLKISSGGITYFFRDGEFNLIPITAPSKDKLYAIPLSESFYSPYEIETCFNKSLNNNNGAYQYNFKSIGEVDNYIHKPIIIQVADYTNDPYEIKSENDLAAISFERICEALIDFEYQRYRSSVYVDNFFDLNDVLFGIVDVYWEHEKYHKRDAMRFLDHNYDKKKLKILKSEGISVSKTLKEHFKNTFTCDEGIKTFNEAKIKGEEYIERAMKEYQKFFEEKWLLGNVYIHEFNKWYNETELYAHWSDSVQNKISKYQALLIARPGYNFTQCEIELKEIKKLWEPFKKYRNSL